jgi:ABC-type multidrug transport system ATPase subunit
LPLAINISLQKIGKKFNREWIFRNLDFEIKHGDKLVILGGNGSGKSTLLQLISGYVTPNEGSLNYNLQQNGTSKVIEIEEIKNYISFASPYIQLIEDLTVPELINHLKKYKAFVNSLSTDDILEIAQLTSSKQKYIRQFSSGMKQRLKLAIAILANTPILLLDEPLSNLDVNGTIWYKEMLSKFATERTIIVCSNAISDEYYFCDKQLKVSVYKTQR